MTAWNESLQTTDAPAARVMLLSRVSSYRPEAFLKAAERLGVAVVQGIEMAPELADYWGYRLGLQFDDPAAAVEKIVAFARERPLQAIIAVDDSAAVVAAMASQALGLPHNAAKAAFAARNKFEMRRLLAAGGVPCPHFERVERTADPAALAAGLDYPVVVKPLALSGSRGVIRANDPAEFVAAFERVGRILAGVADSAGQSQILIESYIPGVEVALEGLLTAGRLKVLALFDKPDPLEGPFFEETIYVTPSRLPEAVQQAIADCTGQAVAALGLRQGPIHAELRVNDQGPWILEVAGRSIGGLCSETLRFGNDISLEELVLRQAMGQDVSGLTRQSRAEGVMMIPIPERGIFKGVEGVAEAEATPLVERVEITAKINYPLIPLPEGESYFGFIFAGGQTPEAVETALRRAHRQLRFKIEPLLTLL